VKPFVKAEMFTIWWKYIYYDCQNRNIYLVLFYFLIGQSVWGFLGGGGVVFFVVFFLVVECCSSSTLLDSLGKGSIPVRFASW